MNWCFKRQVNETWTKISPQEKKVEVVSNSSGETTIFSRIKYHVTVLDRDIFFLCEIYRYSGCGLGLAHATTNISIGGETLTNEIKEGNQIFPQSFICFCLLRILALPIKDTVTHYFLLHFFILLNLCYHNVQWFDANDL